MANKHATLTGTKDDEKRLKTLREEDALAELVELLAKGARVEALLPERLRKVLPLAQQNDIAFYDPSDGDWRLTFRYSQFRNRMLAAKAR